MLDNLKTKETINLKIAVISDLHCHHDRVFKKADPRVSYSHLNTNKLRLPVKCHPVESLLEMIKKDGLTTDFLLCPGDITNKVDVQGFISGWDYINEISEALGKIETIATIGNHDVDSRYNMFEKVQELPMSIKKNFPIKDEILCSQFWAKGFCFIERTQIRILVINSTFFHESTQQTVQGKIDEKQLEEIENYLSDKTDFKLQIALCHHHPIEHARFNLGTEDVIVNGGKLIDILNKFNFDLLIHGHKHDAWLRYAHGSVNSVPIFSSGSFAATSNTILTGAKNTFHIIEFEKCSGMRAQGKITTWEFLPTNGWRLADSGEPYLPVYSGFGYSGDINDLVNKTIEIIEKGNGNFINWDAFIKILGEVCYLTPDDSIRYKDELNKHDIITAPELPKHPKLIGKEFTASL